MHGRDVMFVLHIITHRIVVSPKDIRGSIEERYWIYKDVARLLSKIKNSKVVWCSTTQKTAYVEYDKKVEFLPLHYVNHLFKALFYAIKAKDPVLILLAYPYVVQNLKDKLFLMTVLPIFKLITLVKRNIIIVLDDIDPPVETSLSDSAKQLSFFKYGLLRAYDVLILKLVSIIIVLSESYRKYLSKFYKITPQKFIVLPPPALCSLIPYSPPKLGGSLNVLYAGVVKKERNVELVVQAVDELREEGYAINLILTSPLVLMRLPENVKCFNYSWPEYVNKALSIADVAIIPYPHDKIHYSYTLVAKLFDYLAAGKPIITTPLLESIKVLKDCSRSLIFRDKESLKECLRFLYGNKHELISMSRKARTLAESKFRDDILALRLLSEIIKRWKARKPFITPKR